MKKFLAIVLTLCIVLGMFAGCGESGGSSTKGGTTDGQITLSIGIAPNAKVMSYTENALTKWLEETTGYNIEFVEFAGGTDVATQISTTVAARQSLPDILFGFGLGTNAISTYGKDGYFMDLSSYFEDRDGASKIFWDRMEENFTQDEIDTIVRKMTDSDTGGIYGVPCIETSLVDCMKYQLWINTEWLDTLGLEKPTDIESLKTVLLAFRDKDPNGNGIADEIPLYGSQKNNGGSRILDWIINLYVYYDTDHAWQPYEEAGTLSYVYTQDQYREALKFANWLYEEKLISPLIWTSSSNEMKTITTPASGTALCGIMAAHLTSHATTGSDVIYQYEPLQNWGYSVKRDSTFNLNTFITADCVDAGKADAAFELMMTMYSEDGYMRMRYGEYGVNWVDADEGSVSDYGLPATYKLIQDPLPIQNTAMWCKIACSLGIYAEGETAQISDTMDEWTAHKSQLHALSRQYFDTAAEKNNPTEICPTLAHSTEDSEDTEMVRTNIKSYVEQRQVDFIKGENGWDINDDADWATYLQWIKDNGYDQYQEYMQSAYDEQIKN